MANVPNDLLYTSDHEYLKPTSEPNVVLVGVTDYAQDQLGDVVYLDLPKKGAKFGAHDVFGTIEAVKVELGEKIDDSSFQVKSGVKPGMKIVVNSSKHLKAGDKVVVGVAWDGAISGAPQPKKD